MHTYIHVDLVAYIISPFCYRSLIIGISAAFAAVLAYAIAGVLAEISAITATVLASILIAAVFAGNITTSPGHATFDRALHQITFIRTAGVITQLLDLSLTVVIAIVAKCPAL
jgi:hypothetical protein